MIIGFPRNTTIIIIMLGVLLALSILYIPELLADPPWKIILVSASILGLYILFKSPPLFLFLYFSAIMLFRAFIRIRIGPVYITELVLFALLLRSIIAGNLHSVIKTLSANRRIVYLILAYILIGILSLLRGYHNGMTALRDSVIVFYSILTLLIPAVFFSWKDIYKFCQWIIFLGLILNVLLLIKLLTQGFGVSEMATPRLFGARTSAFLFFVGSLAISGVFGRRQNTRKYLKYFGIAQFCMIILLSGTRNVWIASFASLMLWFIFIKNRSLSINSILRYTVFMLVFIISLISLSRTQYTGDSMADSFRRSAMSIMDYESSASAINRVSWWKDAFIITLNENLLFGKPFGSMTLFAEYDPKYNAIIKMAFHNSYVTALYYTGFIGIILLLMIVFRTLRAGIKNSRQGCMTHKGKLNTALTLAFFFYCVVAFFNVILEGPQSAMMFWLLLGLIIVIQKFSNNSDTSTDSASNNPDLPKCIT